MAFRAPDGVLTPELAAALRAEMGIAAVVYIEARLAEPSLYLAVRRVDAAGTQQEFATTGHAALADTVARLLATLLSASPAVGAPTVATSGTVPAAGGAPILGAGTLASGGAAPGSVVPAAVAAPAYAADGSVAFEVANLGNADVCRLELRQAGPGSTFAAEAMRASLLSLVDPAAPLAAGATFTPSAPPGMYTVELWTCAGNRRDMGYFEAAPGNTLGLRFRSRFPFVWDIGISVGTGIIDSSVGDLGWLGLAPQLEFVPSIALEPGGLGLGLWLSGGVNIPWAANRFVDPIFMGHALLGLTLPGGDGRPLLLGVGVHLFNDNPLAAIGFRGPAFGEQGRVSSRASLLFFFDDAVWGWVLNVGVSFGS